MTLLPEPWVAPNSEGDLFFAGVVAFVVGFAPLALVAHALEAVGVAGSAAVAMSTVVYPAGLALASLVEFILACRDKRFDDAREYIAGVPKLMFSPVIWPIVLTYRVGRAAGEGLSWYWDESKRIETEKYLALLDADDTPRLPSGCNEWCRTYNAYHDYDCTNPENPYVWK